jgi:hypothetical protein
MIVDLAKPDPSHCESVSIQYPIVITGPVSRDTTTTVATAEER